MNNIQQTIFDLRLYSQEEVEKMYSTRFCGIPASFYLLDLRKTNTHCHISSDILAYTLEGKRVSGEIPYITGEDKLHSWVEKDNEVYDSTQGVVWKKDAYYAKNKPINIVEHSQEETLSRISEYLKYQDNMPEMYMAWIEDLKEQIGFDAYKEDISSHIKRIIQEKNLENITYDEKLFTEYLSDLKDVYKETQEFLESIKK